MLQNVRITVGRTWRVTLADGSVSVTTDRTGYRRTIDGLKTGGGGAFGLPWPPYRSRLWAYMYNGDYQSTGSRVLVGTLLPLLYRSTLGQVPGTRGVVAVEALQHPFAVTSLVHLELEPVDPWPSGAAAAALLDGVLRAPLVGTSQVRDGAPLNVLPPLPTSDADGGAASFSGAGSFLVISGLHFSAPDPAKLACALASLFDGAGGKTAQPLKSENGAMSVDAGRLAMVLPHTQYRAGQRLRCLHSNVATLMAYMENLATLSGGAPTIAAQWFQSRAAALLNQLYRRVPLPESNSIYRSRVPEAWIDHRMLAPSINALTGGALPPLPISGTGQA